MLTRALVTTTVVVSCVAGLEVFAAPPDPRGPAVPIGGRFQPDDDGSFVGWLEAGRGAIRVDDFGLEVESDAGSFTLRTSAVGRGASLRGVLDRATPEYAGCWPGAPRRAPSTCHTSAERTLGAAVVERWTSHDDVVEQGWTLAAPPVGGEPGDLTVVIEVSGARPEIAHDGIALVAGKERWSYRNVAAWDAHDRDLRVWLEAGPERIVIHVDDRGATWPITIDPVLTTPAHIFSNNTVIKFGFEVALAGDVDDDGYADMFVASEGDFNAPGDVFGYRGGPAGFNPLGWSWHKTGPENYDRFGIAIASDGNVDGDAYDDVAVASLVSAFVFRGSASGPSTTGTALGALGLQIVQRVAFFDFNGDGFDDLAVGESVFNNWVLVRGSASGIELTSVWTDSGCGEVARIGDLDKDGFEELACGGPEFVRVYFGGTTVPLTSTALTPGGTVAFGAAVMGAGDVDGDGFPDLLVGEPGFNGGDGRAWLFYGRASGFAVARRTLIPAPVSTRNFGSKVSPAGDVNGDGYADVTVALREGFAGLFIFHGGAAGVKTVAANVLTGSDGSFAYNIGGGGDADADGYDDLLVAEYGTGSAYLYRGCPDPDDDGYCQDVDCDDNNGGIHPDALEICNNGIDEDCVGGADQGVVCDPDGDGVQTPVDNCPLVSNAGQTNTDNTADGGDACDTDDDNDTVLDVSDNCPLVSNAGQTNTDNTADGGDACDTDDDNDSVLDVSDNCPLVVNTDQTNTDTTADGGDACDTDDDNDTVLDVSDNCPLVSNVGQTNTDNTADGGDACDTDDDNDTVLDVSDNCPLVVNTDQTNTDTTADGGDACDTDDDNDTVLDVSDNCPLVVNTDQTNTDSTADGGDACDTDDDNDTVLDVSDNCPLVVNTDQTNTDTTADGGDACDTDDDNDTVLDVSDNCPLVVNTDQTNTDNTADGGNACDTDDDNDTVLDVSDNCPLVVNTDQTNTDTTADGGDACDTDDDNDTVLDVSDNCPLVVNTDQTNTDNTADGGNACDTDDDNDTVLDVSDNCPLVVNTDQTNTDTTADGGDACDTDDDNDTVLDVNDNCPLVVNTDQTNTDNTADGGDACDADDDNDTVLDVSDNCPLVANTDQTNTDNTADGGDACDTDDDNDTVLDVNDNCPLVVNTDQTNTDNTADGGDACDPDDDNDTILDVTDNCPLVANTDQANTDGLPDGGDACDADDDEDTVLDVNDNCPLVVNTDQINTDELADGGDACDTDDDEDTVLDVSDNCPLVVNTDQLNTDELADGGNACDADDDEDTVLDVSDNCPLVVNTDQTNTDTLADGGDACDPDDDEDTVLDVSDNCPLVVNTDQLNTDQLADGGDACDADDDEDTVLDENDNCPLIVNTDQLNTDLLPDGGDACDADDDEDTILDGDDNCPLIANTDQADIDGDDKGNACEVGEDNDGDNIPDVVDGADDADHDGVPNFRDPDSDGDGISDLDEAGDTDINTPPVDSDHDGTADYIDVDSDGDGVSDSVEAGDDDPLTPPVDTDDDGLPDALDDDSDADGVLDTSDNCRIVDNADQSDLDRDQAGDVCDAALDQVTLRGSSGCQGGDGDHGLAVVVVLAGLVLAARAGRRRVAAVAIALAVVASAVGGGSVRAEPGFVIHFHPPIAGGDRNLVSVMGVESLPHLGFSGGLFFDYRSEPLVLEAERDGTQYTLVDDQLHAHVLLGLGLFDRFELDVALPVNIVASQSHEASVIGLNVASASLGDVRLVPRWTLFGGEDDGAGLALALNVTLPTGDPQSFTGEGGVTFEPRLAFEWDFTRHTRVALNVGYLLRKQQDLFGLDVGNELTFGAGLEVGLVPDTFSLIGEVVGKMAVDGDTTSSSATTPIIAQLAGRFWPAKGHALTLGGGTGLVDGYGASTFHLFLGYTYTAPREHVVDSDGDGIPDPDDRCVDQPEDKDGFEDGDGCPDVDDDGDGVLDAQDGPGGRCRTMAEDKDGYQDDDGCPDDDNDGDGIADARDGAVDASGLGACRDQPETRNGFEDSDGCPDEKPPEPPVEQPVDVSTTVYFASGSAGLSGEARKKLDAVAQLLVDHPAVARIEVSGHTDERDAEDPNQLLSERRAASVADYLEKAGVARTRMTVIGHGELQPVRSGDDEAAWRLNRRVEIRVP